MDGLVNKVAQYVFWSSVVIVGAYRLINPVNVDSEPMSKQERQIFRDNRYGVGSGYDLDRDLIAAGFRTWED